MSRQRHNFKVILYRGTIKNEIIRIKEENSIDICFHIQIDSVYKDRIKEDILIS